MSSILSAHLAEKHLVTTQPRRGILEEKLVMWGATVVHIPLIEVVYSSDLPSDTHFFNNGRKNGSAPTKSSTIKSSKGRGGPMCPPALFDWLFFTSQNGVQGFFEQFPEALEFSSQWYIATVGPQTAEALTKYGLTASFVSPVSNAKGAAEAFIQSYPPQDLNILWPCGNLANQELAQILNGAGARVTPLEVYETRLRQVLFPEETVCFSNIDMLTFTSASAIKAMEQLQCRGSVPPLSTYTAIACLGPKTAQAALSTWGHVEIQADSLHLVALAEAILEYYRSQ